MLLGLAASLGVRWSERAEVVLAVRIVVVGEGLERYDLSENGGLVSIGQGDGHLARQIDDLMPWAYAKPQPLKDAA